MQFLVPLEQHWSVSLWNAAPQIKRLLLPPTHKRYLLLEVTAHSNIWERTRGEAVANSSHVAQLAAITNGY